MNKEKVDLACELILKLRNNISDDEKLGHVLDEVIGRLTSAYGQYVTIMQLNHDLMRTDEDIKRTEEIMDATMAKMWAKQAEQDPEFAKILKANGGKFKPVQSVTLKSHNMTVDNMKKNPNKKDIYKLHNETESLYNNLWTVCELLNGHLSEFKGFKPKGVREVRNDLMTHSGGKKSGAYLHSFGISSNGPVLKPMRPSNVKAPVDKGLTINTGDFIEEVIQILS